MPPTSPASPAPKRRPPALPEAPETPPHPRRRPRATRKRAKPADNAGRRDGGRASKTTAAGALKVSNFETCISSEAARQARLERLKAEAKAAEEAGALGLKSEAD